MHRSDDNMIRVDYTSLKLLSFGTCGIVYAMDDERVIKEFHGEQENAENERRAFARLGTHGNIVRYLGTALDGSIVLERGQHLKTMLQHVHPDQISIRTKLKWVKDAAEGLRHIHQSGIVHADIGCNNMILVNNHVKMIDFEGCGIDGEKATTCYAWYSYKPFSPEELSERTDIFAFGCAMYEIITGKPPYHELTTSIYKDNLHNYVQGLFVKNSFPDVHDMPLGEVIRGCWYGSFESMHDVIRAISTVSSQFDDPCRTYLQQFVPGFISEFFGGLPSWIRSFWQLSGKVFALRKH